MMRKLLLMWCLITSQIDTAPKPETENKLPDIGLITSQIDTAPKLEAFLYVVVVV